MNFSDFPQDFSPAMIPVIFGFIAAFALVEIILKGWALWRAARLNKSGWFVALLVVNTAGILPLIFLLVSREEYAKAYPVSAA